MNPMREQLLKTAKFHAQAHVEKHRVNVEVYLTNPAGIGEHSDIMEAIEIELEAMAKYEDHVEILNKYFPDYGPINPSKLCACVASSCGCDGDCSCS